MDIRRCVTRVGAYGCWRHTDTDCPFAVPRYRYVCAVLHGAGIKHPETKSKIVASIKDVAQKEPNIDIRTTLVDTLVDLRDPDLYEYLKNSLKTGFITEDFFRLGDLDDIYAGRLPTCGAPKDPIYIFKPKFKEPFTYYVYPESGW